MTTDWMPWCRAARKLGDLKDWEVMGLIDFGVLQQWDVVGDHLSVSEESVRALLAVAPLAEHAALERA